MEDFKNSDWWKELNTELGSFDDSTMSDAELNRYNGRIKGGVTQGNIQAKNGHCAKIAQLGGKGYAKSGKAKELNKRRTELSLEKTQKPIVGYDVKTNEFYKEWVSIKQASIDLDTKHQHICAVLYGYRKSHRNLVFKYK